MRLLLSKGATLLWCLAVLALMLVPVGQAQADLVDGLTAHWNFNEVPFTPVAENTAMWGTPSDLDAVMQGNGSIRDYAGKFGNGFRTPGMGYADVANKVIPDGSMAFSASAWFYQNIDHATPDQLIFETVGVGDNAYPITMQLNAPANDTVQYTTVQNDYSVNSGPTARPAYANWHHVVQVVDINAGSADLYLDGVLQASAHNDLATSAPTATTNGFHMGAPSNPVWMWYIGYLDDVGIWNRALTADEVAYMWNDGVGREIPEVVPEPGSLALLATGLIGLLAFAWRRSR